MSYIIGDGCRGEIKDALPAHSTRPRPLAVCGGRALSSKPARLPAYSALWAVRYCRL